MSDAIKHECGVALLRLKKPLEYYQEKYGTWAWGIGKMYLLLEKQHNRGQDGAGIASVKFDLPPGYRYIDRARSNSSTPIKDIFDEIHQPQVGIPKDRLSDPIWAKRNLPFAGELYLGHLRYGTYGSGSIDAVHPQIRANNWKARTLVVAGNFNLTNTSELFDLLIALGQHPKDLSDTVTVLEKLGHFLDVANERLFRKYKDAGYSNVEISRLIAQNMNIADLLTEATKDFDGGYVMAGMMGHGDAFVCRDPWGIRPAFYLDNEEVTVVASERPAIMTVMNVKQDQVHELQPGHAIIMRRDGRTSNVQVREPEKKSACSFERIYFSRGTDPDIYRERIRLGELLTDQVVDAIDGDFEHTVVSFIPNTAETAFYGLVKGLETYLDRANINALSEMESVDKATIENIVRNRVRVEKIAVKDAKLRTFITQDAERQDLVQHVYDITYGAVREDEDSLVVLDDSIVRGTTLRESILRILDRLSPKRIIVVSSSPQIRYPDCYGIDMARLQDFIAFRAAVDLHKLRGNGDFLQEVLSRCIAENSKPKHLIENKLKMIYEPFTPEELSDHMALLLKHPSLKAEVSLVFQTVENLHRACPDHTGDWYFTGNYPTHGGNRVANTAFINFMRGINARAY